jgi:Cys-tRNA(Pro)/Cys-tRNA(Cys) deacylase
MQPRTCEPNIAAWHDRDMAKTTGGGGTPATVFLAAAGVPHVVHHFEHVPGTRNYGIEAAEALGAEPDRVFKTLLVTTDAGHGVGIVPVTSMLSLKGVAAALGVKRAEMCDVGVAERLTGYVVGGISPFGQKRELPTVIDETCVLFDTVYVSGGRRGLDVELAADDLVRLLSAVVAPITA